MTPVLPRPSARMYLALAAVKQSGEYGIGPASWGSYHTAGACLKLGYVSQDSENQTFLTELGHQVLKLEPLPPQTCKKRSGKR